MKRVFWPVSLIVLGACHSEIYVRDGVTSGNRFHIEETQLLNDDPVVRSWVAYSLSKSVCQLELGGADPAHANSYGCELSARLHLLDEWAQRKLDQPGLIDGYLDTLATVQREAFLDEYVAHYFGRSDWQVPAEADIAGFRKWRRQHLPKHKPYTRVIGSWSYSSPHSSKR